MTDYDDDSDDVLVQVEYLKPTDSEYSIMQFSRNLSHGSNIHYMCGITYRYVDTF